MDRGHLTNRERRRLLDQTLDELASKIGISASLLHHWEHGTRPLSGKQQRRWDRVLEVEEDRADRRAEKKRATKEAESKTEAAS